MIWNPTDDYDFESIKNKTVKSCGYDACEDGSIVQLFIIFTDDTVLRVEPFQHKDEGSCLDIELTPLTF